MTRLPKLIALLAFFLTLLACNRTPDMVLGREKMARLMADLELADALSTDQRLSRFSTDSACLSLRRAVLAKHGVNEAVLDSSLRWYGANLPEFLEVIDRADSILSDSVAAINAVEAAMVAAAAADSVNLWPLAPSAVFARSRASDFLTFEIETDSTGRRGDVYELKFNLDNALSPLDVFLAVDYSNRARTTGSVFRRVFPGDMRQFSVYLQLDSNYSASRIYGYFHLTPAEKERAFLDSISLSRTRLLSDKYNDHRRLQRTIRRHDL